jgi:excisionase family DNA binding protein
MIRPGRPHNPRNPQNNRPGAIARISRTLRSAPRGPPPGLSSPATTPDHLSKGTRRMTADPSGEAAEIPTEPIRLVLTIEQAARRLGIGRTLMYSLVMDGEIESVTIGRLRRIPVECLTEYVTKLRESQRDDQAA